MRLLFLFILTLSYLALTDSKVLSGTAKQSASNETITLTYDELKELIQQEINRSVRNAIRELKYEDFCASIKRECLQGNMQESEVLTSKTCIKCPPGKPGPPGSPGQKGDRGLGLFPSSIRSHSLYVTGNVSDNKVLSCSFFGNPIPTVSWHHNISDTRISNDINYEESVITSKLYLKNLTWEDRGKVICRSNNLIGSDEKAGHVNIHVAPKILHPKQRLYSLVGVNYSLLCEVVANPAAKIVWSRGYGKMPPNRFTSVNESLRISPFRTEDEGFYICTAENYLGTAQVSVQLKTKPFEMSIKPPTYQVFANVSNETLCCGAYGNPDLMSGKWVNSFTGEEMDSLIEKEGDLFKTETNITREGSYRCRITFLKSVVESTAVVKIFELDTQLLSKKQKQLLVKWLGIHVGFGTFQSCFKEGSSGKTQTFHSGCDDKTNTITIIRNSAGKVFGGFTDVSFKAGNTDQSFLFDMDAGIKVAVVNAANAVCSDISYGPCFGNKDLRVESTNIRGYNSRYNYNSRYYKALTQYSSTIENNYNSTKLKSLGNGFGNVANLEVYYRV